MSLGKFLDPYIIADIGCNHEGNFYIAKEMVHLAAEGGANAVKFQTFDRDNLFRAGSEQHNALAYYRDFTFGEYSELADLCKNLQIDFLSTPFDLQAVDKLDPLVKVFKVASPDITNLPLLAKITRKNKPIILSTGAANFQEIRDALSFIDNIDLGKTPPEEELLEVVLLHCVSKYPTSFYEANISTVKKLKEFFNLEVGYSDHMIVKEPMHNLLMSAMLGATVIEKHFTLNPDKLGYDHQHSMTKHNLQAFKVALYNCRAMFGDPDRVISVDQEEARRQFRRSISAAHHIAKGTVIAENDLVTTRPADGIPPTEWYKVVGKKAKTDIGQGQLLKWDELLHLDKGS